MNKILLKNIKANQNVLKNSVINESNYDPELTDLLDKQVFSISQNYYSMLINYRTSKLWIKIDKSGLTLAIRNHMVDESNEAIDTNNYSKVVNKIHLVNNQLKDFRFLASVNDNKNKYFSHKSTISFCNFIKDELEHTTIKPCYLFYLKFNRGCYNTFNQVAEFQQIIESAKEKGDKPDIFYMVMMILQEDVLNDQEYYTMQIDYTLEKFLNQIDLLKDNAITLLGQKIIEPENIIAITRSLIRNHQIKYSPIFPLPTVMNDLVKNLRYLSRHPVFTDFMGIALALGFMRLSIYKDFSCYKEKDGSTDSTGISPTGFAAAMMILLSKIMGCNSIKPTAEAINKLMIIDREINKKDIQYDN